MWKWPNFVLKKKNKKSVKMTQFWPDLPPQVWNFTLFFSSENFPNEGDDDDG